MDNFLALTLSGTTPRVTQGKGAGFSLALVRPWSA
ncbi:succinylglutamate desuccinylase [Salmonella enterica subsp. enterica serovar Typhimurium]|nr:succinylglutamate desuccinylase [Salmonella enterica subsp. enterica serovar Typhimurium]